MQVGGKWPKGRGTNVEGGPGGSRAPFARSDPAIARRCGWVVVVVVVVVGGGGDPFGSLCNFFPLGCGRPRHLVT